ncbi:MAG: TonB-dependent receptor plug domain-containing protein [bacterium]
MMPNCRTPGHRVVCCAAVAAVVGALLATPTPLVSVACAQAAPSPRAADLAALSLDDLLNAEVVYAASRYEQRVSDAPSSVTIITENEIRRHGYRTLADVLRAVPGFAVAYDRSYSYLDVRGFGSVGDYNTRVLLLVDGHRFNDNIWDQAMIGDEFPIDLSVVQRIEVLRGPGASIYGTSAVFGVINVVTRSPEESQGLAASAITGSYESKNGRFVYSTRSRDGVGLLVSASSFRSPGQDLYFPEYDDPATNGGVAAASDGADYSRVFLRMQFGGFDLSALRGSRDKQLPTGAYSTVFGDGRTFTRDERHFVHLGYTRALSAATTVDARVAFDQNDYDGDYSYDYGTPEAPQPSIWKDDYRGQWLNSEAQLTQAIGERHKLVMGLEYRNNIREQQRSYDETAVYFSTNGRSHYSALYAQDAITLSSGLRLDIGVRHDTYASFGGTTNPRVAAVMRFDPATTGKLLYGRAFRAPNAAELAYIASVEGSPSSLAPEVSQSLEAIVDRQLAPGIFTSLSLFENRISDLTTRITLEDGITQTYVNAGEIVKRGTEVALHAHGIGGVRGTASFSYHEEVRNSFQEFIPDSPRHLGKCDAVVPLLGERLFLAGEVSRIGSRSTLSGKHLPAYTLVNLALTAPLFNESLEAMLRVGNVGDTRFADPVGEEHVQEAIEQDGRSIWLGLDVRL